MGMNSKKATQEAIERLKEWVKPGDTLYCVLKHESRSGMSRTIQLVKMEEEGPVYLGYTTATALGWSYDRKHEGVKVTGCGMDMGFHLVYTLSATLFPRDGQPTADARVNPSDLPASRSGYWLKSRWL